MNTEHNMFDAKKEKALQDVFSRAGKIAAPEEFTSGLMEKIEREKAFRSGYKPVISTKAWLVTALVIVAVLMGAAGFASGTGSVSPVLEKLLGFFRFGVPERFLSFFHDAGGKMHTALVILLSVFGVIISWGWFYLLFQGKNLHKPNRFGSMAML